MPEAPDAGPEVAPDAPAEVAPVDAPVEQSPDLPEEAPADVVPDLPVETVPTSDAADAPVDAGAGDAPEGGCVPVPAPTVKWLNPLPQGNPLRAVWGSAADDVYAVGEYGTILHSGDHGSSWQAQASGTAQTLSGIWGSAAGDVYAVGENGTILHSDGSGTWTSMSLATQQILWAVWGSSADDVYAVGTNGVIAHRVARGAWTMRVQNANGVSPSYRGVWGSGGSVWAVGDRYTVIRSMDSGATWTVLPQPNTASTLSAITGAGGTLYLGSLAYASDFANGNVLTSTDGGASWNPIRTPGSGGTLALAVGGGVYAVGQSGLFAVAPIGGMTFSALASGTTFSLNGVWASAAGELFAVGDSGLILHAASSAAALVSTPALTRNELDRVWGSPAGDLVVVGAQTDILQSNDRGAHFTPRTPTGSNPPPHLTDVAGLGNDVYAVGNGGVVYSGDRGVTWTVDRSAGSPPDPTAVEITADGTYAVGNSSNTGRMYFKPTGGAWTTLMAGANANLADFFTADGETWLIGGNDLIDWTGGAFSHVLLPSQSDVRGIGGQSAARLVAAGGDAFIFVSTDRGATWPRRPVCWPPEQPPLRPGLTTSPFFGVCAGGGRTFVVGGNGTVIVSRDDVNWTSVPSGTFAQLMGCTVDDAGTLIVVGTSGTIVSLAFPP